MPCGPAAAATGPPSPARPEPSGMTAHSTPVRAGDGEGAVDAPDGLVGSTAADGDGEDAAGCPPGEVARKATMATTTANPTAVTRAPPEAVVVRDANPSLGIPQPPVGET